MVTNGDVMAAGSRERRNRAAAARAEAQAGEKRRERTVRIIGAVAVLAVVAGIIGVAVVARNADDNANAIDVIEADASAPVPDGVLGADSEWAYGVPYGTARTVGGLPVPCMRLTEEANGEGIAEAAGLARVIYTAFGPQPRKRRVQPCDRRVGLCDRRGVHARVPRRRLRQSTRGRGRRLVEL